MAAPILIVDDDPVQRRLLEGVITKFGHEAVVADGGEAALKALQGPRGGDIAAIILDLAMPGIDGLGVLNTMRERGIALPVIVQTAQGGIETVVSAMRAGAFDFVVKPASPERLRAAIANALKVEAMEDAQRRSRRPSAGTLSFRDIVTRGPGMERVVRLGQKAAASNIPILIEGESGVGKELIARAIQGSGERRGKPFVTVIVAQSRKTSSRASCSATKKAPSRAPPKNTPASSSRRMAERCSSTRSATCRRRSRSSCCVRYRMARSIRSARARRSRST